MINNTVKSFCFTPFAYFKGQENFYTLLSIYILTILTLSGCVTSNQSEALALKPPVVPLQYIKQASFQPRYFVDPVFSEAISISANLDESHSGFVKREEVVLNVPSGMKVALADDNDKKANKKCRIKDRFDRKAVLAYEWGHKRVSLDVDGVNLGGGNKGIKLEYKMNLQRKKSRIQKCRYKSKWQGLIGSGYHEMFVREDNTVWGELRSIKNKVTNYMDNTF